MTDDDATRIHAFLFKEIKLHMAYRPAGGVGAYGYPGSTVSAGSCSEHPFFMSCQECVTTYLANDSRTYSRTVDADLYFVHHPASELIYAVLVNPLAVQVGMPIEPGSYNDVQASRFTDPLDLLWLTAHPSESEIHKALTPGPFEAA